MTVTLSRRELAALHPCEDRAAAIRAAWPRGKRLSAADAVAAGATLDDLVWVASALSRQSPDVERRLRLWMADCAARVLPLYEAQHEGDVRPREAIVAARQFARGEIDDAARTAAWDVARAAAGAAAGAAAWAAERDAAWAAERAAAWDAAWAAERAAAWDAAWDAAGDAARAAAGAAERAAAWAAEEQWQLDRLVARMSDPEPEDWPLDVAKQAGAL